MRIIWLAAAVLAVLATLAHAEDNMAEMVSKYRHEHGLSAVKFDAELTKVAERQARAMADSGIMDHGVAGSFGSRIAGIHVGVAAENIAAGTKTWAETFHMWQGSPGHNANLLLAEGDSLGVAVARNEQTKYKTFWALEIADKSPKKKGKPGVATESGNPITAVRNFFCTYFC